MTTPDNEEKLLEMAFKAEKLGQRIQAIGLYRQVANGGVVFYGVLKSPKYDPFDSNR